MHWSFILILYFTWLRTARFFWIMIFRSWCAGHLTTSFVESFRIWTFHFNTSFRKYRKFWCRADCSRPLRLKSSALVFSFEVKFSLYGLKNVTFEQILSLGKWSDSKFIYSHFIHVYISIIYFKLKNNFHRNSLKHTK